MSHQAEDHARGAVGDGAAAFGVSTPGQLLAEATPRELRVLTFSLGAEWYGLETAHVRSVEPETEITPIPRGPNWLLGVFNLRGTILPAVDLGPLLGTPQRDPERGGLLVVFQWEGNGVALRVDSVGEMYDMPTTSLEPPLATVEGAQADLILGQVRVRDHLIGVLDLSALFQLLVRG